MFRAPLSFLNVKLIGRSLLPSHKGMASSRLNRLKAIVAKTDLESLPDLSSLSLEEKTNGVAYDRAHSTEPAESSAKAGDGGVALPFELLQSITRPPQTQKSTPEPPEQSIANSEKTEEPNIERNGENRFLWLTAPSFDPPNTQRASRSSPSPPSLNLKGGELAPPNLSFSPILPLSKYPYKFINGNAMQTVASAFFDNQQFWQRKWDLFYVYHLNSDQLVALVPEFQFQALLDQINKAFPNLNLKITGWQRENGLVTKFPPFHNTTPRYLGHSSSREEYQNLLDGAPDASFRPLGEQAMMPNADDDTLEAFKILVEECIALNKNKRTTRASKEKRQLDLVMKHKNMAEQVKRVQSFIGLGATENAWQVERRPVFVAIDVEAYERDNSKITEIGIATLDAKDFISVEPCGTGEEPKVGKNWWKFIHARHIRIAEHMHYVNSEFVQGCPNAFEFGQSEVVSLRDTAVSLRSIFEGFSDRNVILVGHGIHADIQYLAKLGFNPLDLSSAAAEGTTAGLLEVLDTAVLYQSHSQTQNTTSLGNMMFDLKLDAWNLHNGGNDAVYTLQSMLAICLAEKMP